MDLVNTIDTGDCIGELEGKVTLAQTMTMSSCSDLFSPFPSLKPNTSESKK